MTVLARNTTFVSLDFLCSSSDCAAGFWASLPPSQPPLSDSEWATGEIPALTDHHGLMQARCPTPSAVNYHKHINNSQAALTKSGPVIFPQRRHYGDECHSAERKTERERERVGKGDFYFLLLISTVEAYNGITTPLILVVCVGRAEARRSAGRLIISLCALQFPSRRAAAAGSVQKSKLCWVNRGKPIPFMQQSVVALVVLMGAAVRGCHGDRCRCNDLNDKRGELGSPCTSPVCRFGGATRSQQRRAGNHEAASARS